MKREIYTIEKKETSLKVLQSELESVRVKELLERGVRVYDRGRIGISGAMGNVNIAFLTQEAQENLATDIAYPYALEKEQVTVRDLTKNAFKPEQIMETATEILKELRNDYTDFSFSERFTVTESTHRLENTEGLHLEHKDSVFSIELALKEKSSANLFDGFLFYEGRNFDRDKFWNFNREYLQAYRNTASLPEGEKLPVFFLSSQTVDIILNKSLNGERYGNGSSLFKGRLGEQIFNTSVNIDMYRGEALLGVPFFDAEGIVLPEDKVALVKEGVFVSTFADKRTHAEYQLPLTGGAKAPYDGKPKLETVPMRFKTDGMDIKGDLKGQMAVFVVVAAGGDFTASGDFATPVQISFLFDGEKIVGKLPEFALKSSLNLMLGDDYIGTYESPFYISESMQLQGYYMTVIR